MYLSDQPNSFKWTLTVTFELVCLDLAIMTSYNELVVGRVVRQTLDGQVQRENCRTLHFRGDKRLANGKSRMIW